MIRLLPALLLFVLAALPAAAPAEERRVALGSFERLRVNGALEVTVTTGASPAATVAADRSVLGDVDLHVEGTTLTVRRATTGRWSEQGQAAVTTPVRIVLTTPRLGAVTVIGGSRVAVSKLSGTRIDVAATGTATIDVTDVQGDQLNAQVIGEGKVTAAGRVATARLLANGSGTIDAARLDAGDVTANLDGPGTILGKARYTAQVSSSGLGTVTIAGRPKCRVTANAGAPVTCGAGQ